MSRSVKGSFIPPSRDGVGASCVALPVGPWPLAIDFLAQRFPAISRTVWSQRFVAGEVFDATGNTLSLDTPYLARSRIFYYRSVPQEAVIPFKEHVIFRDDYLIAVDKPHFLPVTPAGRYVQQTLLVRLKCALGIDTLAPIHRIDRETAGLVLFSIQPSTRAAYQALFRERAVVKHYEAIARWQPSLALPMVMRSRLVEADSFMKMRVVDGEPNTETHIALLKVQGDLARYSLQPKTGQRHQLRVHMEALGMPILNDQIYPDHLPEADSGGIADYTRPLQLLAKSLTFTDPVTGACRQFESQLALHF